MEFDSVSDDQFLKFSPPPVSANIDSQIRRLQIRNDNISSLSQEFSSCPVVFGNIESLVIAEVYLKGIDKQFFDHPKYYN